MEVLDSGFGLVDLLEEVVGLGVVVLGVHGCNIFLIRYNTIT